ncbi:hypothetical protein [Companilactobacillus kimchiensis]|uniref:Abc transporter, permease protein n=1 Tax=Companilactobacillus kimchiensis TaxID=993692 RepID=A0A0R2LLL7_9LACO|nr:hypothetical protein [Companilactobacillus kimchiensis]KRO00779.1 abc transporter, permease protein [Companilactobacillus kimchiensis]
MNKKQLQALLAVDLRLVNPQVTDRYRKKGKTGSELTKKLKMQFVTNTLLFMLIYGFTMIAMNFSKMPGLFTFYVGLFILLGLSQSISGIYNIFFAGKDLASYLPLPFRQKEIFASKILIVSFNVIPFTLPLLLAFFLTSWRSGTLLPLALALAIVVFLIVLTIILFLCSLIVFALTKTKLFQEHQNLMMNILMGVTMVIAIGGIMFMSAGASSTTVDRPVIQIFLPLFNIFANSLSMESGLAWIGLLVILLVLSGLLKYLIVPHLSEQLTQTNTLAVTNSKSHQRVRRQGLKSILDAYNRQLLGEPNLMLQVITNSVMIPIIFIISFAFVKVPANLPLKWSGVFFVAGLAFSGITINQASLVGNLISLDRENFEFIKSLPISMKEYLQRKFKLGYYFQLSINTIMILILTIILRVDLIMVLALIIGEIWGTYLISQHYFVRDYRLRLTNWTNITQLFSRGGGNFTMMGTMFISILLGVIVIVVYSSAILFINQAWLVNGMVAILIIGLSSWIWHNYQQKFWKKFD